jgi:hypothetical protein
MDSVKHILVVVLILLTPMVSHGRPDAEQIAAAHTSLFAQSAAQALYRDFPDVNVSFLLLDAHTGQLLASRWDHATAPIPLGSLTKPFAALAIANSMSFTILRTPAAGRKLDAGVRGDTVTWTSHRRSPFPVIPIFDF